MRTILVALFLLIFFIISIPILIIEWIISKFNQPWADITQLRIVQWAFKCICFISGVKLEIIGEENVPRDEAVLYIGNHRGFFDIITTYSRCPNLTGYISKEVIKKVPILSTYMKRLHCIFLNRADIRQGLQVILDAIDLVKKGVSVCVFPEGTRNTDSDPTSVLKFKEGTFKISTKTSCKIVPMAISGTSDIFESHLPWIHKGRVTVQYGTPIDPATFTKEQQKKIGAYCHDAIEQMLIEQHK